jgi:hypothetical protein
MEIIALLNEAGAQGFVKITALEPTPRLRTLRLPRLRVISPNR